jgi:hypothetical protein
VRLQEWEQCHPFGAVQDPVDTGWWKEFECDNIPSVCDNIPVADASLCCTCVTDGPDNCPDFCMEVPEECHGLLTCDGICPDDIMWEDHQQCEMHIDEWGWCAPACGLETR